MSDCHDSQSRSQMVLRLGKLTMLVVTTAVVFAIAISQWQNWQHRRMLRAQLHEMESHAISPENPPTAESFYPVEVVPRPPIVTQFETLTVSEAEGEVRDAELVLAVRIGNEARAYPLNMLNGPTREVINDELGGRSIAATW